MNQPPTKEDVKQAVQVMRAAGIPEEKITAEAIVFTTVLLAEIARKLANKLVVEFLRKEGLTFESTTETKNPEETQAS